MLEVQMILMGIICTFQSPLFVTSFLMTEDLFLKLDDNIKFFMRILFYAQLTQTLMAYWCAFVRFNIFRGRDTPHLYNKYMPYFHYTFQWIIFYIIPLCLFIWYPCARIFTNIKDTPLAAYFEMQLIVAWPLFYWYDSCIHGIVFDLK